MKYYLAIKRNEVLILVTTWINLENIILNERSSHKRPHIAWLHVMKCPQEANLLRQRLPGGWRNEELRLTGVLLGVRNMFWNWMLYNFWVYELYLTKICV